MTSPAATAGDVTSPRALVEGLGLIEEPSIAILLSTYNGGGWLEPLLESVVRQSHVNWTLWARDDGSRDGTPDVLRRWAERDGRVRFLSGCPEHLGAKASFAWLLAHAPTDAPYLMFCDQDDYWHPDKIEVTLRAMHETERESGREAPLLVHTDMRLVNENLRVLRVSTKRHLNFRRLEGDFLERLLAQNVVSGCTMMINRTLREASLPMPSVALMHDWWIALVAASIGRVVYVDRPTMDYRQHDRNASGSNVRRAPLLNGIGRLLTRHGRAPLDTLMQARFAQLDALRQRLCRLPPSGAYPLLTQFLEDARKSPLRTAWSAFRHGIAMQGFARNVLFYWLLATRRYAR